MSNTIPRFEFRIFGPHLEYLDEKIRKLANFEKFRESKEIYITSTFSNNNGNIKIRENILDIKKLLSAKKGLEQWFPEVKESFPLSKKLMTEKIIPALSLSELSIVDDPCTLREFLMDFINKSTKAFAVSVVKQRFGYLLEASIVEYANVYINGAAVQTVCIESEIEESLIEIRDQLGLSGVENVNYQRAIKRVIGWSHFHSILGIMHS